MAARDDLRGLLERTQVDTEEEARSLEKFKETKMGQVAIANMPWCHPYCSAQMLRKLWVFEYQGKLAVLTSPQTLDYNVRLADLQQTYARLAARTLERNTFVQNIEEKKAEKR